MTRDGGTMTLDGKDFAPTTPAEAIRAGVVTVHQNINDGVVAELDVATNLTLDRLSGAGASFFFNPRRVRRQAREVAARMGLDVDLDAHISDLSLADRQMVAIARAMAHEPKVLILDEPTSSLSSAEANRLFAVIDRLREHGVAILYISHRMSDIRRLADRIVCLRDGRITGVFDTKPLDYEGAVNAMLGQKINLSQVAVKDADKTVFSVESLSTRRARAALLAETRRRRDRRRSPASSASARRPSPRRCSGCASRSAAAMSLRGKAYAPRSTADAIAAGVFLVAKDRAENGIVQDFNVYENISLPFLDRISRFGVSTAARRTRRRARGASPTSASSAAPRRTRWRRCRAATSRRRWLRAGCRSRPISSSSTNHSRASTSPRGATSRLKLRASAAGRATLIFVTELDEALETADRILVMSEHTIVGEHRNADVDIDRLLAEIAGQPLRGAA